MRQASVSSTDPPTGPPVSVPQPFLKWAGGKRALLPQITQLLPREIGAYHEPFVGAGAVLLSLPAQLRKLANDYNSELILAYEAVRDDVDSVIRELKTHVNTESHYMAVRAWDRDPSFAARPVAQRAARLIYLNKCGFNGLYRVNRRGYFNVPFGKQKNPDFLAENNLRAVSAFLGVRDATGGFLATFSSVDFREAMQRARQGDFVYCDPPYDPVSPTAAFTSYSHDGFGRRDQEDLRDQAEQLAGRGVRVLLSNSDTPFIRALYRDRAIFRIRRVEVRRAIAAKSTSRGAIGEVLIDNYRGAEGET